MTGAVFRRTPSTPAVPFQESVKGGIFQKIASEKAEAPKPPSQPGNYEISSEDLERQSERGIATAYSRLAEGIGGIPGNIGKLIHNVTGGKLDPLLGQANTLPTTQELQKIAEEKSGGYLKDEGDLNKIAGEYLQDVGGMLPFAGAGRIPGTGGRGAIGRVIEGVRMFQPLVTPLVGQSSKQISKETGAKESTQDWTKVGSMMFFDFLLNRGKGSQGYINHLYDQADKSLRGGAFADAANLRHAVLNIRRQLNFGGSAPTKTQALSKIEEVLGKMRPDGTIDVRDLVAFRRDFNAIRDSLGGWEAQLPANLRRQAIHNLENVKKQIINAGMEYGEHQNPAFAQNWGAANEASNIRSRSNVALRFLQETLPTKTISKVFGGALGHHAIRSGIEGASFLAPVAKTAIIATPLAATGVALYDLSKVGYRMARSPTLKGYYSELMTSAVRQDGPAVAKAAAKIEKETEKETGKEQELIDEILKK